MSGPSTKNNEKQTEINVFRQLLHLPDIRRNQEKGLYNAYSLLTDLEKEKNKLKSALEEIQNSNIALKQIVKALAREEKDTRASVLRDLELTVYPLLDELKKHGDNFEKPIRLILRSIEEICGGNSVVETELLAKLTARERQLCSMVKGGMDVSEIADIMNLSLRTLEKHQENIRAKLNITSRKVRLLDVLLGNQ